jgi:hypothetical protein
VGRSTKEVVEHILSRIKMEWMEWKIA